MELDRYHTENCAQAAIVSKEIHSLGCDPWWAKNDLRTHSGFNAAVNQSMLFQVNHVCKVLASFFLDHSIKHIARIHLHGVRIGKHFQQIKLVSPIQFHGVPFVKVEPRKLNFNITGTPFFLQEVL